MDTWVAIATIAIPVLSLLGMIYWSGRQVGRVESSIDRIVGIESRLKIIDQQQIQIGTMSEIITRMRSDHKELGGKVDKLSDSVAEFRGRFISSHDDR